jgi:hypothetical protein
MCEVSFVHELGEALGGTTVYATKEELQRAHPACDIVEVRVEYVKLVAEGADDEAL